MCVFAPVINCARMTLFLFVPVIFTSCQGVTLSLIQSFAVLGTTPMLASEASRRSGHRFCPHVLSIGSDVSF